MTKDQKALHTKVNELRNMDNIGVVEVVDRPQSQQVLSARWVSRELDGSYKVRLVARGFEQAVSSDTVFFFLTLECQSERLCAHFSRLQQFTEIQLLLELVTVHFINHRCQLNQSRCTWNQHLKHSWTLPRYGFARSFTGTRDLSSGVVQTENQRHATTRKFDPSTYVKKRAQRSDWILRRHMDDVVGTGPDERF